MYLKAKQLIGETFYSNPFQLTALESDKTCRLDYKPNINSTMQSIQVQMYFWQHLKTTEIESYYETSTRNTVTTLVKSQKHQRWVSQFIPNDLMIKIDDAFENKYVYVDLIRANLFEATEIQEFEAEEDFKENILKLAFNNNDVYNPLYVAPVQPVLNPTITLNNVTTNGVNAIYEFSISDFNPNYLTFQTSQDQNTWNSTNKGATSAQSIAFNGTGVWYFRIIHPEAQSNIIELDLGSSVVAVNDNAQVEKGQQIEIPVLFNDTTVGATTISNVTTPSNGNAVIIENGTKIRYSHNGSNTAFDSFSYTISNGISNDTATVSITIINDNEFAIEFPISSGDTSKDDACVLSFQSSKWHNGNGLYPIMNDFVFNDEALSNSFNGEGKYYSIGYGRYVQISETGQVVEVGFC